MRLARLAIGVVVLVSAIAGGMHHAEASSGFHIERFYNGQGQYCTGLFNAYGQLLTFWDCSGAFGAQRKAVQ